MFLEATQNSSLLWKFLHVQYQGNMFIFQKQVTTDLQLIMFATFLILSPEMSDATEESLKPLLAKNGNFIVEPAEVMMHFCVGIETDFRIQEYIHMQIMLLLHANKI